MKVTVPSLAAFLLASNAMAQTLMVHSPASDTVTSCQPSIFSWEGGTGPYFLSITLSQGGSQISFPPTNATQVTWLVSVMANTQLDLLLKDSIGSVSQSALFTPGANPTNDASCLNVFSYSFSGSSAFVTTTGVAGPATSAPASTTGPAGTGTTSSGPAGVTNPPPSPSPTPTPGATTASTKPATSAGASSAAAASTSAKASSASSRFGVVGIASFVGAAVVALFA